MFDLRHCYSRRNVKQNNMEVKKINHGKAFSIEVKTCKILTPNPLEDDQAVKEDLSKVSVQDPCKYVIERGLQAKIFLFSPDRL